MSFSSLSTINSNINTYIKPIPVVTTPTFAYKFVNSSDLSNGYILNYATSTYDLTTTNVSASNFYPSGIYIPNNNFLRTPNTTLTSNKFTIVCPYLAGSGRIFTVVNPTRNRNIEFRRSSDFGGAYCFQLIGWNNQYYNGPGGYTSGPNGTSMNPFILANSTADTLIMTWNGSDVIVYTNTSSSGVTIPYSSYSYSIGNTGDTVYCFIGSTAIVNGSSTPETSSNWSGSTSDLISSFRFYNYLFNSSQITSALSGTYPGGI